MDFEVLEPRPQGPLAGACYDRWLNDQGETVVQFFRAEDGFIVRFADLADFAISADCTRVACTPEPGTTSTALRDLFRNQIMPMILGHGGEIVVHASGVAGASGVLAFAGPTCRGKSTLAAAFARSGTPLLTDDGLILNRSGETYLVRPNTPGLRLREDSETALFGQWTDESLREDDRKKRRIEAGDMVPFRDSPMPLRAIYLLGTGEAATTQVVQLRPAAALASLMNCCFILDVEDKPRVRAHFDRLAELVRTVPCFVLDFPRRYDYLPEVIRRILEHAGPGGSEMNLTDRFEISEDVVAREVGGETMLLDLASGTYFGLDPVGGRIWQLLESGSSPAEACDALIEEYEVSRETLESDVMALLSDLLERRLIVSA